MRHASSHSHVSGVARLAVLVSLASSFATPAPANAACDPPSLFGPPVTYTTGPHPLYFVSRDFDEDGVLDLAVTNSDYPNGGVNNSVAILRGLGGTSYALPVLYPVGLNPHMLVAGDFNEDGITDLVAASKWSSAVSVLIGHGTGGVGDGTFGSASHYGTGGYPFQIVAEDLDGDDITDLAVSINSSGAVALMKGGGGSGVGDGTFALVASLPLSAPSTGLEGGDFDQDGITDLIATENAAGTIAFLRGTGTTPLAGASFATASHISAGGVPFDLAAADFNEDGSLDLAVSEQFDDGGILVLLGTGNGTFLPPTNLATGNTVGLTTDDFNQDGITDIAAAVLTGLGGGGIRVCLGAGTGGVGNGTFASPTTFGPVGDAYQLLAGDFDGDTHRDLAVSYFTGTSIALLPGTCGGGPPPADPRYPVLTDVRDVSNDEGGRVFLTWIRSSLDAAGGPVNAYRIWRRIPPALAAELAATGMLEQYAMVRPQAASASTLVEYWEAIAQLPAQRLEGYGYTAATPQDSVRGSNPYSAFFVTALTANIDEFYSSNVDSAYSVDNIPPGPPGQVLARYEPTQVELQWEESTAGDFEEFHLHRGTGPDFVPSPATLIRTTTETSFLDGAPVSATSHYKLAAVDMHGNASEYVLVSPPSTLGVWVQTSVPGFSLRQPSPNPGDGRHLGVEFMLADASPATLELLDVVGRVVLARDVGHAGSGPQRIDLVGTEPLPAGLYFVRLRHRGISAIARTAVVR